MIDSLFTGIRTLVWLVGLGTLLAGAIGVSNIMMVTVRERDSMKQERVAIADLAKYIEEKIENFLFLFLVSIKIYFFLSLFIGANSIIIDFYFL